MTFLIFGRKASLSLTSLQILSIHYTLLSTLSVLDLTLIAVNGFIQTDIYSKPIDNHIYLLKDSSHPARCTKVIPLEQPQGLR